MRVAVIAGDGIGKEVTAEAVKVITAVEDRFGQRFELEHLPWGADYYLQSGITIPPNGYDLLREFEGGFYGKLSFAAQPITEGFASHVRHRVPHRSGAPFGAGEPVVGRLPDDHGAGGSFFSPR